jgi:hypothetical protein
VVTRDKRISEKVSVEETKQYVINLVNQLKKEILDNVQ